MLSQDKLFKTTQKEALQITKSESLVQTISSMRMSAKVNLVTLHHFCSSVKIEDEKYFEIMVDQSNKNKSIRKKIMEAKI